MHALQRALAPISPRNLNVSPGIVDPMSVLSQGQATVTARRGFRPNRVAILALGVFVVPLALTAILNSYGALTEESAIRMAFATVGGQTIAVLTGILVVAITVARRNSAAQIAVSVIISLCILLSAIATVSGAGDLLIERLEIVARISLLN